VVDLVLSRSHIAARSAEEREAKRREVLAFYDDYGRGMDGMRLPYTCLAYRATVVPRVPARPVEPPPPAATVISTERASLTDTAQSLPRILDGFAEDGPDNGGTSSMLLIDFR
jgi:hypothetical protein